MEENNKAQGAEQEVVPPVQAAQPERPDRVTELERTLRRERAEFAAALALTRAGAKNLKAARALLAFDAEELADGEGEQALTQKIEQQVAALKADAQTGFLFETQKAVFYGFAPAESRDAVLADAQPATLADAVRKALIPNG